MKPYKIKNPSECHMAKIHYGQKLTIISNVNTTPLIKSNYLKYAGYACKNKFTEYYFEQINVPDKHVIRWNDLLCLGCVSVGKSNVSVCIGPNRFMSNYPNCQMVVLPNNSYSSFVKITKNQSVKIVTAHDATVECESEDFFVFDVNAYCDYVGGLSTFREKHFSVLESASSNLKFEKNSLLGTIAIRQGNCVNKLRMYATTKKPKKSKSAVDDGWQYSYPSYNPSCHGSSSSGNRGRLIKSIQIKAKQDHSLESDCKTIEHGSELQNALPQPNN